MSIKKTRIWKLFSSVKLAIWLLALIAVLSLLGTLIPQNQEAHLYIDRFGRSGYQALEKAGLNDIYASPLFIFLIILFAINLAVCLLNRFSLRTRMLGSILSHVSILIILIGALVGMFFGQKGLIKIGEGEEVSSFAAQDKRQIDMGFSIRLDKFIYNEHIDPKEKLEICSAQNDPSGAGKCRGHIAEIPTEIGVESDIANTGYRIKILRYLGDF
ncbi:MAG: cytochrome c biogenesis protein ResB, partial [Candidatus Omnitrophota bacterium]|nr:cytochrome c biogenesis protein ResB [Candidatus Omnitrophota bacterium]